MLKTPKEVLEKLKIDQLNPMQEAAGDAISSGTDVVLFSATGTGKTLAFLLPLLQKIDIEAKEIQALILVPSRELAIQIEQVIREMGAGVKVNAFYGGRTGSRDRMELHHKPAILIGTPGRISDHLRRERFDTQDIHTLILDEFDKSLEVGFESEMKDILSSLHGLQQRVLTSATKAAEIPAFVGLKEPTVIDQLEEHESELELKRIICPTPDRLKALIDTLQHIGNEPGIVFCNLKETIHQVSHYLDKERIDHGCYSGDMEQIERERALIKFRNGTHRLLVATDLAARGLDIDGLKFIIHYELPHHIKEFTHRNGRTARMHQEGTAYLLTGKRDPLPSYVDEIEEVELRPKGELAPSNWKTLFISGGRKDKISKGDIAGTFFKQGGLDKSELGIIEVKKDCAFVAVATSKSKVVIEKLDNKRIKKKKVRIRLV